MMQRQATRQGQTFAGRARLLEQGADPGGRFPARGPRDPAVAPGGYDQDYWGMAVLFRDLALRESVSLRAGVPVVYGELRRAFGWFGLEAGGRAFQSRGDGTVELTYAQAYRDGSGRRLSWVQVGYAVIEEFWARQWDEDALACFCDPAVLAGAARAVCERWQGQRLAAASRRPAPSPEPMTWNRECRKRRALSAW